MADLSSTTDIAKLPSLTGSRNKFNYSKRHFTTCNVGEITPIYFNMLIEPGDTIKMDLASLVRTTTPLFPSYDSLICEVFAFWRSHNHMYIHWPEVMGQNKTGDWIAQNEYSLPQIKIPSGTKIDPHSILAHLCWPIQTGGYSGSKIGCDLYNFICNEWFNNNTVMPPVMWSDGDEDVIYDGTSLTGGTLRNACKNPDYFNSGVPEPQRANAVNIPILSQAVIGNGTSLGWTDGTHNIGTVSHPPNSNAQFNAPAFGDSYGKANGTSSSVNSWLNENIAIGITKDPTKSGLITDIQGTAIALNSLRMAAVQQQIYEADAYFGTRAREIIKSRWGVNTSTDVLAIPELIGHMKFNLDTFQVAQTSQNTDNSNVGDLGAFSQTSNVGHLFTKSFDYWGSIMVLAVIRQEQHTYAQGLPAQFSKKRRFDFHWPEMEHLGFTGTYKREIYMTGTADDDEVFNYRPINQEYRYERDEVTGEFNPSYEQSLDYQLYVDDYDNSDGSLGSAPVFSAEWVIETPDNVDRNLVFNHSEVDQIHMAHKFRIEKTSKLAQYGYPGLTRF